MLRILICCGGGMSSGVLAKKLVNDVKQNGYEGRIYAECSGFKSSYLRAHEFDIAMCCPHQRYEIPKMMKEHGDMISIPLTVIPPRLYGTLRLEDIVQDAVDLIEIYHKNPVNPCHFEGEDNSVRVDRFFSHRRSVEKKPNDIEEALQRFEKLKGDTNESK